MLLTFIIEWQAEFQLEISENNVVIFCSIKFHRPQVKMVAL